jgi:hypothetical protein
MKRRKTKPITLKQLKGSISTALIELERIYMDPEKHGADTVIRAVNSLSSLANSYTRLIETYEFEQRIEALENDKAKG